MTTQIHIFSYFIKKKQEGDLKRAADILISFTRSNPEFVTPRFFDLMREVLYAQKRNHEQMAKLFEELYSDRLSNDGKSSLIEHIVDCYEEHRDDSGLKPGQPGPNDERIMFWQDKLAKIWKRKQ